MHAYTPDDDRISRALADYCLDRLAMEAPLDRPLRPDQLEALAGQTVTATGIGGDEALRLWADVLGPACLSVDHPRYLSFIPSAPTKAAAGFDMLVGASSVYGGSWLEGARRNALAEHTGEDVEGLGDPDGDEALEAYNRMLARLREHG